MLWTCLSEKVWKLKVKWCERENGSKIHTNCNLLSPLLPLSCMCQGHTLQDIHSGSVGQFRLQVNGLKYQRRAAKGGEARQGSKTMDEMRVHGGFDRKATENEGIITKAMGACSVCSVGECMGDTAVLSNKTKRHIRNYPRVLRLSRQTHTSTKKEVKWLPDWTYTHPPTYHLYSLQCTISLMRTHICQRVLNPITLS